MNFYSYPCHDAFKLEKEQICASSVSIRECFHFQHFLICTDTRTHTPHTHLYSCEETIFASDLPTWTRRPSSAQKNGNFSIYNSKLTRQNLSAEKDCTIWLFPKWTRIQCWWSCGLRIHKTGGYREGNKSQQRSEKEFRKMRTVKRDNSQMNTHAVWRLAVVGNHNPGGFSPHRHFRLLTNAAHTWIKAVAVSTDANHRQTEGWTHTHTSNQLTLVLLGYFVN